jgi:4'-phosphopantetheinyl transferase EntD
LFDDWEATALAEAPMDGAIPPADMPEEERSIMHALKTEQRRREFRAGREAARRALAALGGRNCAVLPDDEGAPKVWSSGQPTSFGISLSHGGRRAFALAWSGPDWSGGIDWVSEDDRHRTQAVMRRWAQPEETEWLAHAHGPALLWGAREAMAKATRTGMFVFGLRQVHVIGIEAGRMQVNWTGADLRWFERDDGVVVAARIPDAVRAEARALAERTASKEGATGWPNGMRAK